MTFAEQFLDLRFPVIHRGRMEALAQNLGNAKTMIGLPSPEMVKTIRSNTTVFAFSYKNGAILAGDKRTSDGYFGLLSDTAVKIKQLSPFSAVAFAGSCNVIQFIEDNMVAFCTSFKAKYGKDPSPDGQANHLRDLLEPWYYLFVFYWYWSLAMPVFAAFDKHQNRPRIIFFDETGWHLDMSDPAFAGTGCGFEQVRGLIRERLQRREEVDVNVAIDLTMRAMIQSGLTSTGVSDARITLPSVATIEKCGFKWVDKNVLAKKRDQIVKEMGGLR